MGQNDSFFSRFWVLTLSFYYYYLHFYLYHHFIPHTYTSHNMLLFFTYSEQDNFDSAYLSCERYKEQKPDEFRFRIAISSAAACEEKHHQPACIMQHLSFHTTNIIWNTKILCANGKCLTSPHTGIFYLPNVLFCYSSQGQHNIDLVKRGKALAGSRKLNENIAIYHYPNI